MRENPVSLVDLPAAPHSEEIPFLTPSDVRQLVEAVTDGGYAAIDRTLFLTAAMTGLRMGELRALRWRGVDRSAARVRVRRNYVRGEFGTPRTRRSERSVPLAHTVADALVELHALARRTGADDLVFADPLAGGPLDDNAIRDRLRTALRAAGLDIAHRFHDLRHTFGTAMAAAGMPIRS